MEMKKVHSSNVHAIGYDPTTQKLRVEFHGGSTYEYHNVDADAHRALMDAPSHGKHLHAHFKGKYRYTPL